MLKPIQAKTFPYAQKTYTLARDLENFFEKVNQEKTRLLYCN